VSEAIANKIVAELATYWWRHPAACDTPEGIHRWWLGGRIDVSVAEVESALGFLETRGLIEKRLVGDRSIYRMRADADGAVWLQLAGRPDAGAT